MYITYVQRLVYASRFNKHLVFKVYFRYLCILRELMKKKSIISWAKMCISHRCFKNLKSSSIIVLCSEHSLHVRWCAVCPPASVGRFSACTKIETDGNEQEYLLVALCMSVLFCIYPVIVRNSFVRCTGVICCSVRRLELECIRHA